MNINPKEEFRVNPFDVTPKQLEEFLLLISKDSEETRIDTFLRNNLSVLAFVSALLSTGHDGCWILKQPNIKPRSGLTKGLIPDYLLAGKNSDGIQWSVLELKGANEKVWNKDKNGNFTFTSTANKGFNQLTRYIDYCATHQATIREQFELPSFSEPKGILMIGREKEFKKDNEKRKIKSRQNMSNSKIQIRTYDALIRRIKYAGQINHQLSWLQKLKIDMLTTPEMN